MCSAEAMSKDSAQRETWAVVIKMPQAVQEVALAYLSLFRPAKSALSWDKALRVARELAELLGGGYVQVEDRVARPCPPMIWRLAIDEMLDNRERLRRPMKNHNYLRQVAYDLADKSDAQAEKLLHEQERGGNRHNYARPASINPLDKLMNGGD
jgi:hypothetical protein